jgi:hypothetical protein
MPDNLASPMQPLLPARLFDRAGVSFRRVQTKCRESFFGYAACDRFAQHPLATSVRDLLALGREKLFARFLTTAKTCSILNLAEASDPPFRPL